ncbi:methyltransferase domain-containing protein [Francisellaceae bacterium]|nr:methyltransferase domain-containing protein [Francisellaceae bacterium]
MHSNYVDKIATSFNRAHQSYDEGCFIQNNACDKLISNLLKVTNQFDTIADFGCGTGASSVKINKNFNYNQCFAVDSAQELLECCKAKVANDTSCVEADFNNQIFDDDQLSLVFANMSLQWCYAWPLLLDKIYAQLKDGGILAFSIPLDGTFAALKKQFRNDFLTPIELKRMLNESHFSLITEEIMDTDVPFKNPMSAIKHIKQVGANTLQLGSVSNRGLLTRNTIKHFFKDPNHYNLSYKIGIFIAKKGN